MKKKQFEKLINNLSDNDEKHFKQFAGNVLGEIRNSEYKDNLPALSYLLLNCGCFDSDIKIESIQRTILRWIREGLPLKNILCISECLNRELDTFLPEYSINVSHEVHNRNEITYEDYKSKFVIFFGNNAIIIKNPSKFLCLQSLLDFLYTNYLNNIFEPYTYGYEWFLSTPIKQLIVPIDWFLQLCKKLDSRYVFDNRYSISHNLLLKLKLIDCHIYNNSHLEVISSGFLSDKKFCLISTNERFVYDLNLYRDGKPMYLLREDFFEEKETYPSNIKMYKYHSIVYSEIQFPKTKTKTKCIYQIEQIPTDLFREYISSFRYFFTESSLRHYSKYDWDQRKFLGK